MDGEIKWFFHEVIMIYNQVSSKALRMMRVNDMQVFVATDDYTRIKSFANQYGGKFEQETLIGVNRMFHTNKLLVIRCVEPCRPKKRPGRKPNVYSSGQ